MDHAYTSIREVLQAAFTQHPYARDGATYLYTLPADAFKGAGDYLLKVNLSSKLLAIHDILERTTTLTPVHLSGCTKDFGQPLIKGSIHGRESLQIVHKIPGTSLSVLHKKLGSELYNEKLASLPVSTFKEFLKDILFLSEHGLPMDNYHSGNILLEESDSKNPVLHIIDVLDYREPEYERIRLVQSRNNLSTLFTTLFPSKEIQAKLYEALQAIEYEEGIHFPRTESDFNTPLLFSKVEDIKHVHTLTLDDTPYALRQQLKEAEKINQKQVLNA